MFKRICLTIIILIIYLLTCHQIYLKNNIIKTKTNIDKISIIDNKDKPISKLIIKKININHNLYDIKSPHNNIEENITILEDSINPDQENSIMYIAAHSGTGKVAYFNNLDKLNIDDEIELIYKNKTYKYTINKIWEEKKNGYIHINKENNKQLILTTCSPTKQNKQLVISSILKGVY